MINLPELNSQLNWTLVIINGLVDLVQFVLIFWLLWDRAKHPVRYASLHQDSAQQIDLSEVSTRQATVFVKPVETTPEPEPELLLTPEMKVPPKAPVVKRGGSKKPVVKKTPPRARK